MIFHICLIFGLSLLGALLMAVCLFFLTITIREPDGKTMSDYLATVSLRGIQAIKLFCRNSLVLLAAAICFAVDK